jgi:hypothetical protein
MSGIASLGFIVVAFVFKLTDLGQARYWIVAAVACYVIASFWVWYKNRPSLSIDHLGTFIDAGLTREELERVESFLTIRLLLVNTHPANNAIKEYRLTVEIEGRPHAGISVPTREVMLNCTKQGYIDLEAFKHDVLTQGWPKEGWLRFLIPEITLERVLDKPFSLTVTDVYNVKHLVRGRTPPERVNALSHDPRYA